MATNEQFKLLDLPEEIIEHIISHLTYHETSEVRIVCKLFNKVCQQKLNKGFGKVEKFHSQIQKEVKNKLPRRESERRNHELARHVDILSAIETRLSLLGMSYVKYIENGLCCFIPGKVLDELLSILHKLQLSDQPPRSHEFLQELRDISSMAMEHFDEKIAPGLKGKLPAVTLPRPFSDICVAMSTLPFPTVRSRTNNVRSEVSSLGLQVRAQQSYIVEVEKDVKRIKTGNARRQKQMLKQERRLLQQEHMIAEMGRKMSEMSQKIVDMSSELQKLKEVSERRETTGSLPCVPSGSLECESTGSLPRVSTEEIGNSTSVQETSSNGRPARNKAVKRKIGPLNETGSKKMKEQDCDCS